MELVRSMVTVGSLFAYFACVHNTLLRSEIFTYHDEMENKVYSSGLITEIRVKGRMECLVQCTENSVGGNCIAASYNSDSNLCRLYDDQLEKNNVENDQGWHTWGVFRGCGSPPEVPNADVINGGDFVNAVVSYKCKSDFKPCDLPTESRCQANGEWTTLTGHCSRFRWHHPAVIFEESLPCHDQDVIHIEIKATPTAETRMFFALKSDADYILIVDCRFNYHAVRKIFLNTQINDIEGEEVISSAFPFRVNEIFVMQITLSSGYYQISVGEQTWTFKERAVGVIPNKICVEHDVSVELVEYMFRGCGSPPEVPNADVIKEGDFVNAVASYTCKSDFKPCDLQTESRCQANGEWTAITGLCSQFRWHRPVVRFEESLPCQDREMLRIKIKATPTAETQMIFALKSDKDHLLIISMRFKYGQDVRQLVLNDRMNGVYGAEVRPSGFPFTVNEIFVMEITLTNGNYQISVGQQTWTFKERLLGATPNTIIVDGDINVDLVEILI